VGRTYPSKQIASRGTARGFEKNPELDLQQTEGKKEVWGSSNPIEDKHEEETSCEGRAKGGHQERRAHTDNNSLSGGPNRGDKNIGVGSHTPII